MTSSYYPTKVLLTGASGYVAGHMVDQLFALGVEIIGTVRSAEKGDWIADRYPGFKYEIVKDLTDSAAFEAIFQKHPDIDYVLHAASSIGWVMDNFTKNLIEPAVAGTTSVLSAAHKYGKNVKKVVLTSSIGTAYNLTLGPKHPEITMSEETWTPLTIENAEDSFVHGYNVSKKLAEESLWEFQKTQKPSFAVAAMLTPVVYGPPIHQTTYSTVPSSLSYFKTFFDIPLDTKEIPPSYCGHADVRDIARIHIKALFDSKFDNGRWLILAEVADEQEMIDILHKYRPKESANMVVGTPNSSKREELYKVDDSKTRKLLDFEYIPVAKTTIDMFDALLALKQKEEAKTTQ